MPDHLPPGYEKKELEKDSEAYLVRQVKRRGGKTWKWSSPANAGVCDRIVVFPSGIVWFIEMKSPTGKRTPKQIQHGKELVALGCQYQCLAGKVQVDEFFLMIDPWAKT